VLFGLHAVAAALQNPNRQHIRLTATRNAAARLDALAGGLPIDAQIAEPRDVDKIVQGAVHQGVVLECEHLANPHIQELAGMRLVVALDQITDPQNVGAIIRSTNALGADAVITTARHSPEATGTMAKAASGALEWTPYVTVSNLAEALSALGDLGFYRIGLDSDGDHSLTEAVAGLDASHPRALVLGAEGKGLRHLTRQRCDQVARLDMPGRIKSLNVSNAAVLALNIASTGD